MKRVVILTLTLSAIITVFSYGQSTDVSVQLGRGLFSFGGEAATKTSFINVSDVASSYTNNLYGKYSEFSIGYSYGFTNYTEGMLGANLENQSRYFRLGLSYIIK